jgi:hypothetical protein
MTDKNVTIIYIGPHASGVLSPMYSDESYEFVNGKPFDVPDWVANGHPGEPGVYEDADGPHEFTSASTPIGGVVLEDCIPPLGGLLDQPDNWTTAPKPKTTKAVEAQPEDGAK